MKVKDQSGASAAGEWLKKHGRGTYNARAHGEAVADRKSQPITWDRFHELVTTMRCARCGGVLANRMNQAGGGFLICLSDCGYWAGWRARLGKGEEAIP